ncbi:bifunctional 2',3'-cyclic-nucleotide 2'-phosphodiesterase/3'-nucleotidase [Fictibacillus fluitans]|uniref:Bifunctional 2',3'-cyclic-nucleotide 2'-phosphodiesterase/3'-nucleotidase n=1 Tax=Fictibacillus fluitans TaxID=3058422 RepID=A0ABT8HZ53_9BACL|nr:bifunctional 2',3'-cyclic-nucleotide 2'-phosphodiesterase/3'-nucleotidase [Fictibacillus sp. NE201]MDN4526061.1 bifunctional 2',3'-cyclic-nucleotide 2'-phosphodiesterase/3'-nucleotidase [Fictibacillus sp. NE201]
MSFTGTFKKLLASSLAIGLVSSQLANPTFAEAKPAKKTATKEPFKLSAPYVDFSNGTNASVTVTPKNGNPGKEAVVFQLMKGKKPVSQAAVETDIKKSSEFSAHFNSKNPSYWVQVFVVKNYNGDTSNFGKNLATPVSTSPTNLRIMETTDIHTNLVAYDYYKAAPSDVLGLSKTATLVKQARKEVKNSVLVDNGDLIQGTPLGTYKAKIDPLKKGEIHPVYKAMNQMGYDMATFGNHEFNYGLDYLQNAIKGANFPYVNANVFKLDKDDNPYNNKNKFTPYKIVKKKVVDQNGKKTTLKIGYLGLVTPQIMDWDKNNLEGKVMTRGIIETAKRFVPQMKREGADIIIAMTHSGFNGDTKNQEDVIYSLSKVKEIDAITFSHTHKVFPAADEKSLDPLFKDAQGNVLPGVDNAKGTINGVPAVQAGYGGSNLGIIDLNLQKVKDKWKIYNTQSSTKAIYDKATGYKAPEDAKIVDAVKKDVDATVKYVNTPIGKTTDDIYSYFALVKDDPSVQVVTNAQKWYVENYIKTNKPQYKDLPVLSVGAPFKAGRNGVDEYTEIKKGDLTIRSAADLYLYDNTLKAIKIKGSDVKEWLEMSAGKFNTIDPGKSGEQALLNDNFPVYNFDVIDGVTYQIDVTKPARYDVKGAKATDSSRIKNLEYNGQPIDPDQEFIVVTNNYRASGGGNFPGIKGAEYVVDSADENRQILMDYITEQKEITPTADNNWSIAPIQGDANVTFTSSPNGAKYLTPESKISYTGKTDDKGFGIYKYDLKGSESEDFTLSIMHTNDTHAHLDNVAKRITAIKNVRAQKPSSLLIDAGDVFSGTLYFNEFKGQADLDFMNLAKYDVMTFGNHEFDLGASPDGHKALSDFIKKAGFPFVSANVDFSKDSLFDGLQSNEITSSPKNGNIYTGIVKEVDGEKVGIFGLTTEETKDISSPEAVVFKNYKEEAEKAVKGFEDRGINKIVAVTHIGYDDNPAYDNDLELAKQVDGIDVIVGGHSHTQLDQPVVISSDENGKDKDPTVIVQAYQYSDFLGTLDVDFDKNGKVVKEDGKLIKVADQQEDPEAANLLKTYSSKIEELKNTSTGATAVNALENPRSSNGGPSVRSNETPLGNLITDGMLDKAKQFNSKTVIALQNGGGIRSEINAGDITLGEVLTTLPFGNTLATMNLTGAEILQALEHSVDQVPNESGAFLHMSGMKIKFDSSKPAGARIVSAEVEETPGQYTALDPAKEYVVATNAFTAKGGDNYPVFKKAYEAGRVTDLGFADWENLRDYVAKLKTVDPKDEDRIVDVAKQ